MPTFPDKQAREKCWASRDALWKCLDDNNNDKSKCQDARKKFEESCKATWVKYFDQRKEYLKYQEKINKDGFEPIKYETKEGKS